MIKRHIESVLLDLASKYPVITVTGPRQSGKTTVVKSVFSKKPYVNLEIPDVRALAIEDPRSFLNQYADGAILDEIQRAPELVSYIQAIVDERAKAGMFVLTGSQQFEIMTNITQSLAGRTALIKLLPFSISELGGRFGKLSPDELIYAGFYPRIYDKKLNPTQALGDYFETYVERDIRKLVNVRDLNLFQKFVRLCAGRVGGILNMQGIAADSGVSHTTVRQWLSMLEASYIVCLVQPYHMNINKRLIKSPKLYFYDVGLAAYLMGIENIKHVATHPLRGNLFENMAMMEMMKYRFNTGKKSNISFYRDNSGNEIDAILASGADIFPVEIKAGATVNPDYFRGFKRFSKVFPGAQNKGGLIYAGEKMQEVNGIIICPVAETEQMLRKIE